MDARPKRRIKTHSAATGYVYEYYFVGKRAALREAPESPASEYIFDVSPDRKVTYAVSVFVQPAALEAWSRAHGRALTAAEQYAAAKLRLLQTFDELENVREQGRRLVVDGGNIEGVLEPLGLE